MNTESRRIAGLFATLLIVALLASTEARGQAVGSIRGQVTDPSAAVIPDATIRLKGNGTTRNEKTDGSGRYTVTVPPGLYTVRIDATGFVSSQQQNVTVTNGQIT